MAWHDEEKRKKLKTREEMRRVPIQDERMKLWKGGGNCNRELKKRRTTSGWNHGIKSPSQLSEKRRKGMGSMEKAIVHVWVKNEGRVKWNIPFQLIDVAPPHRICHHEVTRSGLYIAFSVSLYLYVHGLAIVIYFSKFSIHYMMQWHAWGVAYGLWL